MNINVTIEGNMGVRRDYQKRTMDELTDECLDIIKAQPTGLRCGMIGEQLFRGTATFQGSAPYARLAGKVMLRLQAAGLARYAIGRGNAGWYPTAKALAAVSATAAMRKTGVGR